MAETPPYEPIEPRARWVQVALAIGIVIDAVAVVSGLMERSLLARIANGESVTEAEANANDLRQGIVGVVQTISFIAAAVLWILWFNRAYRNLPALGAREPRFKFGWAIGSWFVPILNVWRPKQIANDIWRASDPAAPPDQGIAWRERALPSFFLAWWSAWIVSEHAYNVGLRLSLRDDIDDLRASTTTYLIADGLGIVAGAFAIAVVRATTERQRERARVLTLE